MRARTSAHVHAHSHTHTDIHTHWTHSGKHISALIQPGSSGESRRSAFPLQHQIWICPIQPQWLVGRQPGQGIPFCLCFVSCLCFFHFFSSFLFSLLFSVRGMDIFLSCCYTLEARLVSAPAQLCLTNCCCKCLMLFTQKARGDSACTDTDIRYLHLYLWS